MLDRKTKTNKQSFSLKSLSKVALTTTAMLTQGISPLEAQKNITAPISNPHRNFTNITTPYLEEEDAALIKTLFVVTPIAIGISILGCCYCLDKCRDSIFLIRRLWPENPLRNFPAPIDERINQFPDVPDIALIPINNIRMSPNTTETQPPSQTTITDATRVVATLIISQI